MTPLDKLKSKHLEYSRYKWPSVPDKARVYPSWITKTRTTNGLTNAIIHYIFLMGWIAERNSNEGRVIDERKQVTNVLGQRKTIGTVKRIPGSGMKGTADVFATIRGRHVAIEIKNAKTKDTMSEAQKKYRNKVIKSGGIYKVITDLESGIEWLDQFGDNEFKKEFWD
jgi:hypothetical protein